MTRIVRFAGALGAAGLAALPFPAAAGPLAPTKASQLVTAFTVGAACSADPDGAQFNVMRTLGTPEGPFVIPPKQVLVITRVELTVGAAAPSEDVALRLVGVGGTSAGLLVETRVRTSGAGTGSGVIELPTPVAVRGDTELCATASDGATVGVLTGFFAKDK
jgi:hypothetical protein